MSTVNPNKRLPNPKKISNAITKGVVNKRIRLGESDPEKQRTDDIVNQLFSCVKAENFNFFNSHNNN